MEPTITTVRNILATEHRLLIVAIAKEQMQTVQFSRIQAKLELLEKLIEMLDETDVALSQLGYNECN